MMDGRNAAKVRPPWHPGQAWITPESILGPVRAAMGGTIALDPCTEPDTPTRAERFYALPTNGLAEPWDASTIWCNPPYGEARRLWIRRCLEVGQARRARIALLVPADVYTELGQAVLTGSDAVVFIAGYPAFAHPESGALRRPVHRGLMLATWGLDLAPLAGLGVIVRTVVTELVTGAHSFVPWGRNGAPPSPRRRHR